MALGPKMCYFPSQCKSILGCSSPKSDCKALIHIQNETGLQTGCSSYLLVGCSVPVSIGKDQTRVTWRRHRRRRSLPHMACFTAWGWVLNFLNSCSGRPVPDCSLIPVCGRLTVCHVVAHLPYSFVIVW